MNIPLNQALLCANCDNICAFSDLQNKYRCEHCGSSAVQPLAKLLPALRKTVTVTPGRYAVVADLIAPTRDCGTIPSPSRMRLLVPGFLLTWFRRVSKLSDVS